MQLLRSLVSNAARIAAPLRDENRTLLHGDFWPGNVSILEDNSHVVFDWQLTAIGPAILDLLVFIKKSTWWFTKMPMAESEIIDRYRSTLYAGIGVNWEDDVWEELWDHALMWRFLQEWTDLLAASPEALLLASADQLDRVWLDPVRQAARRRLPAE
jgi:aminoglycoside phosphotransferase (APT) family kinase protein